MPTLRHTLRNATLGLLTAALLLGATEGALRALGIPSPGLYEGDPAWVWWLRPDLERAVPPAPGRPGFPVTTNALGLRGPLPPEGDWTLALGCSTTFGWGVYADEAWPARATALLDEPVINGGVPGWSTEQARRGADRYLDLGPSRVILGFLVRDAWAARQPDAAARPTPWPLQTAVGRLLQGIRARGPASAPTRPTWGPPEGARVPPQAYAANLRALAERAAPAQVWILAFPTVEREPLAPWIAAARSTGLPVLEPRLPASAFFPGDPVHLTPAGHAALAGQVAAALTSAPATPGP